MIPASYVELLASFVIVPNELLHYRVERGLNTDDNAEGNCFYNAAYTAAFNDSRDWLDEMNEYVYQNKLYAYDFIEKNSKGIVIRGDATYLIWVDLSYYTNDSLALSQFIREKTGLFITDGARYGGTGNSFIRINLATSKDNVKDGLNRLVKALKLWENK